MMRKWSTLVLLAAIVTPLLAEKPPATQMVTVEQLEQALATVHGVRDGNLAKQISDMKLTERLSDARLARLENELRGPQTRLALVALADESQFLNLPAAEIPSTAVPGAAGQAELLARTMDYVKTTVAKLPNFYATQTTTRFVGTPTVIAYDLHEGLFPPDVAYRRLSAIGTTSATVLYRDGQEVYADKKDEKSECSILGGVRPESLARFLLCCRRLRPTARWNGATGSRALQDSRRSFAIRRFSTINGRSSAAPTGFPPRIAWKNSRGRLPSIRRTDRFCA
jgi:hypothetical protein